MLNLLYVDWDFDPVIFSIGNFHFRWYGLIFLVIFAAGGWLFAKFCKREKIDTAFVDPLFYTVLLGTLIGARLGHVIFYQPDYYFGSWQGFWEIFMPWRGGLASHGGAVGILLGMLYFMLRHAKRHRIDFLWIMDRLCILVAFAGCLIRLGNLANSEIYGDVTSLPWGFIFRRAGETEPRHPTQIYEALCYLILGLVLLWVYVKRPGKVYRGFFFGAFLLGCFGARFLIEFVKEPQVEFERTMALDMGQLLSIPFILAGIGLLVYSAAAKKPAAVVHPQPVKKEPTHYAHSA